MSPHRLQRRRCAPPTRLARYHRPHVELLESRLVLSVIDHSGGFASHGDLTSNGSASFVGSVARLTTGAQNQAGSIFTNGTVDIGQFTTQFVLVQTQVTNPSGGGLTFTIQNVAPTAVGTTQDGLGYAGIGNSVAIKFDLFDNEGEGPSSTGIFTNGRNPTVRQSGLSPQFPDTSVNLGGSGIDLHSQHPLQVTLTYAGSTLSETILDLSTGSSFTTSYNVNIPSIIGSNTAFVGFTGSTGGFTALQDIRTWQGTFGPQSGIVPSISSLSPNLIQEGSSGFTLTVNGSGFVPGAQVQWTQNGTTTTLTPFFVTNNQLQVAVPSSLLTVGHAGTASVSVVETVGQNTLTSGAASFTITPSTPGIPFISSLSPSAVQEGSNDFILTVNGSGFVANATVQWTQNGTTTTLTPFFVTNNQLQVVVPSSLLTVGHAGTASVNVVETIGQTTVPSDAVAFTITPFSTSFPVISSLSPNLIQEGSSGFTLTVNGSGFVPGAQVQWTQNGTTTTLTPFFVTNNQLQVAVPSSLLTVGHAGTASVSVVETVGQNTLTSGAASFTITPSSTVFPVISGLSPSSMTEGSGSFILTVNGSGFVSGAKVQWTQNGTTFTLTPFFTSNNQLQVVVPSALLTAGHAGAVSVSVIETVGQNTLISGAASFTINPASTIIPVISSLSPSSVQEGSNSFTLTINGSGFVSGAKVQWTQNGTTTRLTPFFTSNNQLQVVVPSSLLTLGHAGTASVSVIETVGQNTLISSAASFTISPASTVFPVISSLSPSSVQEGSGNFTLTVNGSGFVSGAKVQWTQNGTTTTLTPFFITNNQLQVVVPASLLTVGHAGTASVSVIETVGQNTLISGAASFTITPASTIFPVISSLSPTSVQEGSGNFILTVNGSGFVSGATVQWTQNGTTSTLTPFFVSSNQLRVVIPSSLLTPGHAGTVSVSVVETVGQNTLISGAASFTISPASNIVPVISGLSPTSVQEGSGSFTLTVNGSGFVPGAQVQWTQNGTTTTLTPFSVSSNQLQVVVPASLVAAGHAGTASVSVVETVGQNMLISGAASFTISPSSTTLVATGLNITATVNMAEDFTVAQFTDLGPNAQPGAYAVPIDFGDGTPLQAGRVTQPGGPGTPFFVDATHTYTQTGTFSVHVRIFKEIGPSAETFSTATVSGAGAPPGPAGRSAGSSGKNLLIVQTAEQEVMVSTTLSVAAVPLPILGSDSVPSGQSDHADDLYWQLLGGEGGSIDPNGWACDALASALEKPTWS